MTASTFGRLNVVKLLLQLGASAQIQISSGVTALEIACEGGHAKVARALIQAGLAVDRTTNNGDSPLMFAAVAGRRAVVQMLLANGASINHANKDGWAALMNASWKGHEDVVRLLLKDGANVQKANSDRTTILGISCGHGHVKVARELIRGGAVVDTSNVVGESPLLSAARNGHIAVVQLLLKSGAVVDFVNNDGWTALMLAASKGHNKVVRNLVKMGASIDKQCPDGSTALRAACENGHVDATRILIECGASIDKDGDKTLEWAARNTGTTETQQIVPAQQPSIPSSVEPSTESQSAPESGKKPRKRRFVFGEKHDVLLLKAMLADQGVTTASGTNKPAWKSIEASVNSQGLPVSIHTIRTHLGILVNTYRRESHSWDFELSEKQQLMRAYCKKLDGEESIHDDDSHSYESAPGADGQIEERVEGTIQAELLAEEATANSAPADSGNSSGRDTPLATGNSTATQNVPDTEAPETAEPAPKRQKVEVETILQRFVEDQIKRQEEQREQERARLNEHQVLQRQTIDLQKRSLDIQEKAMNMQERLMALMEKVMDKLG